jgi:hypothetical protein
MCGSVCLCLGGQAGCCCEVTPVTSISRLDVVTDTVGLFTIENFAPSIPCGILPSQQHTPAGPYAIFCVAMTADKISAEWLFPTRSQFASASANTNSEHRTL